MLDHLKFAGQVVLMAVSIYAFVVLMEIYCLVLGIQ